jgi:hypothetical protein
MGLGIQDMPGCLVSGLMIRDNVVPEGDTIYDTDGVAGISAVLIEQNQANWYPAWATPGFLVQDNSPPPAGDSTPDVRRVDGAVSARWFAARSSRLSQMSGP